MARYTGPVCRLCRRERMKLYLKGTKCDSMKCPIERRPYPPGDHGRSRRQQGITGENLLRMLELRLDNAVFRAGWAASRNQARQFVRHGHVTVNGRRVDIPSYRMRKGDVLALKEKSRGMIVIRHNVDTLDRQVPPWLEAASEGFEVTVRDLPLREHIDIPVREQLIVELYSK